MWQFRHMSPPWQDSVNYRRDLSRIGLISEEFAVIRPGWDYTRNGLADFFGSLAGTQGIHHDLSSVFELSFDWPTVADKELPI